ncbi:MAG: bifunctional adenosylcobinamide kinase/adenosylcobinamide-phosphate guanylyltransferase [Pseudomonadota bacterium]
MERHHLVLGGARSGKSGYAERLLRATGTRWAYVATAEAGDAEMAARIARHRADRGAGWETREAPLAVGGALRDLGAVDGVLIDCLTLWLSNLMAAGQDPEAAWDDLRPTLERLNCPAVLVSNEVGLSIVPENALARAFRDAQGRLNQSIAATVGHVTFVAAGLPLPLKSQGKART